MALEGKYNLDLNRLARLLWPSKKRGEVIQAYLRSAFSGLSFFQTTVLDEKRSEIFDLITPNAQVLVFENRLNKLFRTGNGVYITNLDIEGEPRFFYNETEGFGQHYLYNEDEGEDPFYLYNETEFENQPNFIINYPCYLDTAGETEQLRFAVNYYRVAGTTFIMRCYGSSVDTRPPVLNDDELSLIETLIESAIV